jgi:L-ascorbate metabolism protein UlaG (beta-lactamase superfamily)
MEESVTRVRLSKAILIFILLRCPLAAQDESLDVTYIANEGFLLVAGGTGVLIDALFTDRSIQYADVPADSLLSRIVGGAPPFHDVQVMLVTHAHRDHFAAAPVGECLRENKDITLICPPQAVHALQNECDDWGTLRDQVVEVLPAPASFQQHAVGGIQIKALRIDHSPYMVKDPQTGESVNRHRNVQNVAYIVTLGGFKVLHVGDATLATSESVFAQNTLLDERIDVAFLGFYDQNEISQRVLTRYIQPRKIVFMHLPRERTQVDALETQLHQKFPTSLIFKSPLEKKTLGVRP